MSFDVLILGAGPAGLGAAYRAAAAGHKVCVLERSERVGGLSGSFELGGMRVDFGSHRLHPSIEPRILEDLGDLLGQDLQTRTRNGRIRLGGRWISFPLKARELITAMPPAFVARAARDALLAPLRKPSSGTFAGVLQAGLGPAICRSFYFPYARKIWGVEPDRLAGEQARRRVTADSPSKILKRIVLKGGSGGAAGSGTFFYPRRGYGQISEALARAASKSGARIELGADVNEVRILPQETTVTTADGRTFGGTRVWSTLPITVLARILVPGPPQAVRDALGSLPFRSMILAYLVLERDRYTSFDAHYLPEAFTRVTRVSEPKNYRSAAGPDGDPSGRTVLCAEIPCDRTEALWSVSDDDIADLAREGLVSAGLPDPRPIGTHVLRFPHAYPIYLDGYQPAFRSLDAWLDGYDNLLTFGRQGLFAHDNLHHALAMAWAACDQLGSDGAFDARGWAAARRRFEEHVVED